MGRNFWELRDKKIVGTKFYRQRPVYYSVNDKVFFFIVDFCADGLKLIIEADGDITMKLKKRSFP
ncbi:MAG: DUF559 domain-containing protein [Ignavibacteriales bacterium]|nr:DUF559 domain-containing protein [Ignavibacteriales bacterium]